MNKIISQCQEIREKLPMSKEVLEKKVQELDKMKAQLNKYDKPHLKQKIKECEVILSQTEIQATTIGNKLESVKENLSKMKAGKGEIEGKIQ